MVDGYVGCLILVCFESWGLPYFSRAIMLIIKKGKIEREHFATIIADWIFGASLPSYQLLNG